MSNNFQSLTSALSNIKATTNKTQTHTQMYKCVCVCGSSLHAPTEAWLKSNVMQENCSMLYARNSYTTNCPLHRFHTGWKQCFYGHFERQINPPALCTEPTSAISSRKKPDNLLPLQKCQSSIDGSGSEPTFYSKSIRLSIHVLHNHVTSTHVLGDSFVPVSSDLGKRTCPRLKLADLTT